MRRLEQAALKIHLVPLCTFQGETVHCYFAFTNLWVCLQISPNIFVDLRKYIYVKTYSCWWIWIFGWMAGNIILMDLCKYLAGRWNTSWSGASTENSKSTWICVFPNAAVQCSTPLSPRRCCSCSPWRSSAWWRRWRSGGWRSQTARKRWEGRPAKQNGLDKHKNKRIISSEAQHKEYGTEPLLQRYRYRYLMWILFKGSCFKTEFNRFK